MAISAETSEQAQDKTKSKRKLRDCVIVEFLTNYQVWRKGEQAGFDPARAMRLCGITPQTPEGLSRAVGKVVAINKDGQRHETTKLDKAMIDEIAKKNAKN